MAALMGRRRVDLLAGWHHRVIQICLLFAREDRQIHRQTDVTFQDALYADVYSVHCNMWQINIADRLLRTESVLFLFSCHAVGITEP